MKYIFDIQGMHCSGCQNLIQLTVEELGYLNTKIDLETNKGTFESDKTQTEVNQELTNAFSSELEGYTFSNLNIINN